MAQKTDIELIQEAEAIKNATAPGTNTALKIGTMLEDIIDSKINNGTYKVFTALLTQNGGDSPEQANYINQNSLTIGVSCYISQNLPLNQGGTDFTNVGAINNEVGTWFIATGTNPIWGNQDGGVNYNLGAPIVKVLQNTIGNVWFNYEGVGNYSVNSNGLFTIGKTMLQGVTFYSGDVDNLITINTTPDSNSISKIYLNKVSGNNNYIDGYLYSPGVPLEIRVYN